MSRLAFLLAGIALGTVAALLATENRARRHRVYATRAVLGSHAEVERLTSLVAMLEAALDKANAEKVSAEAMLLLYGHRPYRSKTGEPL